MPLPGDSARASPDDHFDNGPASPGSADGSSCNSTPGDHSSPFGDASPFSNTPDHPPFSPAKALPPKRASSHRASSDPQTSTSTSHMTPSSTVTGTLNNARRPPPSAGNLPPDLMQKARALQQQRMAMSPHPSSGFAPQQGGASSSEGSRNPSPANVGGPLGGAMAGGVPGNLHMSTHMNRNMNMGGAPRPTAPGFQSAPVVPSVNRPGRPGGPSLSERRAMKLGGLPGGPGSMSPGGGPPKLSDMGGRAGASGRPQLKDSRIDSKMNDFKKYIDTEKGWITFEGAATITRTGVNFASGQTFKISLDEIQVLDELGKGNYGTVFKVRHAKPAAPRFGQGLSGFRTNHNKAPSTPASQQSSTSPMSSQVALSEERTNGEHKAGAAEGTKLILGTTGKVMAMKEIRLELDEAKFATILKELTILHRCVSPYIIDFYGAFFQEGAVYMCIEFMDGGSIDKLYAGGIPENVLRKITYSTVMGLKTLKEKHKIIHRDVKPTNILANSNGQVKICDFGVSGNLVASIAKTNIGCQSYMAPERISGGGGMAQGANAEGTYSVQSDIWSLGLTIIECAMGRYPYPPEVSSTIFSQLSVCILALLFQTSAC